jgi:dipeptidase E
MKRIVLFSTPYENKNLNKIFNLIFPIELKHKKVLFMPSQGVANTPKKFIDDWDAISKAYNITLELIDNASENATNEIDKLLSANILIISGGDPFNLILNLRRSGLDSAIKDFVKKEEFILAGYSAGAYILTPNLETAKIFNENYPGDIKYPSQKLLNDSKTLGIVNFEIIAHYSKALHEKLFRKYIKENDIEVKTIDDDEYIVINY